MAIGLCRSYVELLDQKPLRQLSNTYGTFLGHQHRTNNVAKALLDV